MEGLQLCSMYADRRETASHGGPGCPEASTDPRREHASTDGEENSSLYSPHCQRGAAV